MNNDLLIIVYIITNLALIPLFLFLWLLAFTSFLSVSKKNATIILTIIILISVAFEILLFYLYMNDLSAVGSFSGPFLERWTLFFELTMVLFVSIELITGLLFAKESLRSSSKEIRLKGAFLILAFIIFAIGAIIDASGYDLISNLVARLLIILGSILFYIGFVLPKTIKSLFIKTQSVETEQ